MKKFKAKWQITHNWQLLFPLIGILILCYSCLKLTRSINIESVDNKFSPYWKELLPQKPYLITYILGALLFTLLYFIFLKIVLYAIYKLEGKWVVNQRWELIRIFIVFAITGSSSMFVGRPFIQWIGITKDNLYPFFYWLLFVFISLIFYQFLLLLFGWLFGQFKFFWNFEKKMLKRFGLGKYLKD